MIASDKLILLTYLHQTNLIIAEGKTNPRVILLRLQKGLEMWRRANEGVTCLQCGMAWSEHPANPPGSTNHLCITLTEVKA